MGRLLSKVGVGAVFLALFDTGVAADERRNENGFRLGPPLGCYLRSWSASDLAGSPQQVIKAMRVRIVDYDNGPAKSDRYMRLDVILADQGLAQKQGLGGTRMTTELSCSEGYKPEFPFCYARCSGERMVFPKLSDAGMVFRIGSFRVSHGFECNLPEIDLAGGRDGKVAYRLDRVADSECEGL